MKNVCFCPRYGNLKLDEDSTCIYNYTPIYNHEDKISSKGLANIFLKYTPKL
jgi:hypothetical protein